MAKAPRIPYLTSYQSRNGLFTWRWLPGPSLRALGFKAQILGHTEGRRATAAINTRAMELNEEAEAAQAGRAPSIHAPRKWTFGELVAAYKASSDWTDDIKQSTRNEYASRLKQLNFWAMDGNLPVTSITQDLVKDLKKELLADDGSRFKCAAMLRVLNVLMNWAVSNRIIEKNPAEGVKKPGTASRRTKMDLQLLNDVVANRIEADDDEAARLMTVAFWTLQRSDDIRMSMNRMTWRVFEGMDPRDRATLANPHGEVKGFRLQQSKTGKWVDCPMPPALHDMIENQLAKTQHLFPHHDHADRPLHKRMMGRVARRALDALDLQHMQLRDMRRSGMIFLNDMGADRSDITAISGHDVMGKRTILDTYMPPDTRTSCRAMADALRGMEARAERQKKGQG